MGRVRAAREQSRPLHGDDDGVHRLWCDECPPRQVGSGEPGGLAERFQYCVLRRGQPDRAERRVERQSEPVLGALELVAHGVGFLVCACQIVSPLIRYSCPDNCSR